MKDKYPDWVIKHKRKGTAIHKIGNNHYLYEVTSRWDKKLKRAKKITRRYLGVITPEGIKEPGYKRNKPTTVKEYGGAYLLLQQNKQIVEELKKYFSCWWKQILVVSFLRVMHRSPFKHMSLQYKDSWISEEIRDVRIDEKSLHTFLEEVGKDRSSIIEFLRSFISGGEALLIDLTHVFSLWKNISLAASFVYVFLY